MKKFHVNYCPICYMCGVVKYMWDMTVKCYNAVKVIICK
jgi:hypothetical protein